MTEAKSQSESQLPPDCPLTWGPFANADCYAKAMRAAPRTRATDTIHGKQSQVAIKLVNIFVYKATVLALPGILLVQDERKLPEHASLWPNQELLTVFP